MANLTGGSWGATPGTLGDPGGVVTWSIAPAGQDVSVFPAVSGTSVDPDTALDLDYLGIIRQAFADWSSHGNIEFMQIEDPGGAAGSVNTPDIRIFFGPIPGSTLGWAFFPPDGVNDTPRTGDILLDVVFGFGNGVDLFTGLALHEIGHAIGLDHVPNGSPSVMTPTINLSALTADDIAGVQQVYGAQDNADPVYTMPNGLVALNILDAPDGIIVNGNVLGNQIDGTDTAETFFGAGGADRVLGRGGFDTIQGGAGNDTLDGGAQADELRGGQGQDNLSGGDGFDALFGDDGHDTIRGGSSADRLFGGTGDDILDGGQNSGNSVDGLWGDAGNDTLQGGSGFDFLDGGTGNDFLDGGTQADNLFGGDGDDTLYGGQGLDRLVGDDGNDRAFGGAGNDGLFGLVGDDTLYGQAGDDRFFAGIGDDQAFGGAGNDTIYAGAGFDTLTGNLGDDLLFGNFNADTFVFADFHGMDMIADFEALNDFEKIDLAGVSAITGFSDLQANHMTQTGGDVVIETGNGNQIMLLGVSLADLDEADFLF